MQKLHTRGGFTVRWPSGEDVTEGFAVAIPEYNEGIPGEDDDFSLSEVSDEELVVRLTAYVIRNQDALERNFLGGWEEKDRVDLDVVEVYAVEEEASQVGRERGEKAVGNLRTGRTIWLKSRL